MKNSRSYSKDHIRPPITDREAKRGSRRRRRAEDRVTVGKRRRTHSWVYKGQVDDRKSDGGTGQRQWLVCHGQIRLVADPSHRLCCSGQRTCNLCMPSARHWHCKKLAIAMPEVEKESGGYMLVVTVNVERDATRHNRHMTSPHVPRVAFPPSSQRFLGAA